MSSQPDRAAVNAATHTFISDVRAGLSAAQKTLPPKYLYDALGSALFEAITQLPEYGLWRAELSLLSEHAEAIARGAEVAQVIELGSGSATKTVQVLKALLRRQPLSYWSVDMSPSALEMTRRELSSLRGLSVHGVEAEYLTGLDGIAHSRGGAGHTLVLLLGSALGNFDYLESQRFLQRVRRALQPGDSLLLGIDLEKPVEQLVAAYDDALGVTAAFDLNVLVRINRELGGDFVLPQFRHEARFNTKSRDVEMHLVSRQAQCVRIDAAELSISLAAGESIHTESSHKYSQEEIETLSRASGFRCVEQWLHEESRFISALYRAV